MYVDRDKYFFISMQLPQIRYNLENGMWGSRFPIIMNELYQGKVNKKNTEKAIEECETCLFSPYTVDKLGTLNLNEQIVELVDIGCELEDVESLIPEKLQESINEIRRKAIELLKKLPKVDTELKKWLD